MNESNEAATPSAIARSYLESFASGSADTIAAHVSPDFVNEHTSALGAGCIGRDVYRQRLVGFLADMVDLRYEIENLIVEGSEVAAFYTMTANWQDEHPISVRGVQRLVVGDGLITHRTDYWDSAVFLTQTSPEAQTALAPFGIQ
ncbi:MAG: nuclear transport factor 2 family protein [Acidimicrobiaceae bacterium]|nr:nuclear transport factor 2 family protein [Acidimicrobiaceae bacterium]